MTNPIPSEAEFYLDEFDAERFWAHVEFHGGRPYVGDQLATAQGECWLWNGAITERDYGRFRVFGEWRQAHRIAFKDFGNRLPDELEIDHLCRIHSCVNPAHLEPVTRKVNMERGIIANRPCCKNGHAYTDENTRMVKRGQTEYRLCRQCRSDYARDHYLRGRRATA